MGNKVPLKKRFTLKRRKWRNFRFRRKQERAVENVSEEPDRALTLNHPEPVPDRPLSLDHPEPEPDMPLSLDHPEPEPGRALILHNPETRTPPRVMSPKPSTSSTMTHNMRRHIVDGKRVIEKTLTFQHFPLFDCPSGSVEILEETRKGLHTQWLLGCKFCRKREIIHSEDPSAPLPTNDAAVNAAINAGIGYAESVQYLAGLGITFMGENTYQRKKKAVAESVKETALECMLQAGREERAIAVASGNVDEFGDACITVICDGAWSKRSYGSGYSAQSGTACIIGANTGKVLFYGVRNRYCSICDPAERQGSEPAQHQCHRNWKNKPPNAMEADIICEGFRDSMSMHNLKYTSYIGDGDSNVAKKLAEAMPYGPAVEITKTECRNHLMRVFCKRIKNAQKNTQFPLAHRKAIGEKVQKALRRSITSVIDLAIKKVDKSPIAVHKLQDEIQGCALHIAGKHDNCNETTCDPASVPLNSELLQSPLFTEVMRATKRLVINAPSFLVNKSNNPCENFNSVLNKQVAGKRVNLTQRDGYIIRVASTVIKFNSGDYLRQTTKDLTHGVSPGSAAKKLQEKTLKTKLYKKEKERTKRRRQLFPPSQDYGATSPEPVAIAEKLSDEELEVLIQRLTMTTEQRSDLEAVTREQAECPKWREERRRRLTASNFGAVARMTRKSNPEKRAKNIIFGHFTSRATAYGVEMEDVARKFYEEQSGKPIKKAGLFVGETEPFLAASPDGIIDEDTLIEIKCPYNVRDTDNFLSAISKMDFMSNGEKTGKVGLKKNHRYHYQIQGQMALTGAKQCVFFVYTPQWQWEEVIYYDDQFWQAMKPKLWSFYSNHMAPFIKDFIF